MEPTEQTTATANMSTNVNGTRKLSLRIGSAMHAAIAASARGDVSDWIREAIRQRLALESDAPDSLLETLRAGRLPPRVADALRDLAELYQRPADAPAVRDTEVLAALSDAVMGAAVSAGLVGWRGLSS